MSGFQEFLAQKQLGRQTDPRLQGDTLTLHAVLKLEVYPNRVEFDFHLWLQGQNTGLAGEYRRARPPLPNLDAVMNWLRRQSWSHHVESLNAARACSPADGQYLVTVARELDELMHDLCQQIREANP